MNFGTVDRSNTDNLFLLSLVPNDVDFTDVANAIADDLVKVFDGKAVPSLFCSTCDNRRRCFPCWFAALRANQASSFTFLG
jgi:hypothetical protein